MHVMDGVGESDGLRDAEQVGLSDSAAVRETVPLLAVGVADCERVSFGVGLQVRVGLRAPVRVVVWVCDAVRTCGAEQVAVTETEGLAVKEGVREAETVSGAVAEAVGVRLRVCT